MSSTIKVHTALFTVALIYGANYTIAKEVMDNEYIAPLCFVLLRVISGVILFWTFHALFIREKIERKDFGLLALCGLTGVAINQMLFFEGLKLTQPINASLIMTTTPILIILISPFLTKERITALKVLGILCGAAGAILLILYGKSVQIGQQNWKGDMLIFINASSYGLYLVLVKRLMTKYNAFTVLKWMFTFGLFYILPFGLPQIRNVDWFSFPLSIWLAIGYVLLFTTFFAYLFNAYALKKVNPSIAGIYIYLQPLLAGFIAISLGKDELTLEKVLGGGLIFLGVFLATVQKGQKKHN